LDNKIKEDFGFQQEEKHPQVILKLIGYVIINLSCFARHFAREDPTIPNNTQSRERRNVFISQLFAADRQLRVYDLKSWAS